jgi:hypothetical protein
MDHVGQRDLGAFRASNCVDGLSDDVGSRFPVGQFRLAESNFEILLHFALGFA